MTADRHIINAEAVGIYVIVNSFLHHLEVGIRPHIFTEVKTFSDCRVVIADICKVLVPVIVIIGVIVVSVNCFVAEFSALLTESERETYIIFGLL